MTTPEKEPLKTRYTLILNSGDTQIVFMSFGLLNTLSKYFADVRDTDAILHHPDVRQSVLIECLSERDTRGAITTEFGLQNLPEDFNEVWDFLTWVQGHMSDFFTQALTRAKQGQKRTLTSLKANT